MTRILLVDDNTQNLYLLDVLFQSNGYQVDRAENGEQALRLARLKPPDLIISDILMPVMDGFSLCRAWMADPELRTIPFVFYTATYTDDEDKAFALSLGATRFFIKPEDPVVFLQHVRELLADYEQGRVPLPQPASLEEHGYYKAYNTALIRKLEDKLEQLDAARAEAEKANFHLESLHVIHEAILRGESMAVIAEIALKGLLEDQKFQRGSIVRFDFEKGLAEILATTGLHSEAFEQGKRVPIEMFGSSDSGDLMEIEYVEDTAPLADSNPGMRALYEQGVRSGMKVPMVSGGQPIGSINIGADEPSAFTPEQREHVLEVANLLAVALVNVSLYETVRIQLDRNERILETTQDGFILADARGQILDVNSAYCAMSGYGKEELLSMNIRQLEANLPPEKIQDQIEHMLAARQLRFETQHRSKEGRILNLDVSISILEMSGEQHVAAFVRDISERIKQQERMAKLLETEKHARKVAETIQKANLALSRTFDLHEVVEAMLSYLEELVPYSSANIMLREDDEHVRVLAIRGYERWTDVDKVGAVEFKITDQALIHTVVHEQTSVLVKNTREEAHWEVRPGTEHVASWIGVPLIAGNRVLGLYSIDHIETGFFTQEHVHLVEALAGQAAIAVRNAQLVREVRAQNKELRDLAQRLAEIQEEERKRLGRELHDRVGQNLTAINLMIEMAKSLEENEFVQQKLEMARDLVDVTANHVRDVMAELRPPVLDDYGLLPALHWYASDMQAHTGIQVKVRGDELTPRPDPSVEIALFRTAQEALTNVVKHAEASLATVELRQEDEYIHLSICDDGKGMSVTENPPKVRTTWGLVTMRERIAAIGGQIEFQSHPGEGTCVWVEVPRQ